VSRNSQKGWEVRSLRFKVSICKSPECDIILHSSYFSSLNTWLVILSTSQHMNHIKCTRNVQAWTFNHQRERWKYKPCFYLVFGKISLYFLSCKIVVCYDCTGRMHAKFNQSPIVLKLCLEYAQQWRLSCNKILTDAHIFSI